MQMRKVTFGGANSLDNFIARTNDDVSWLQWNKEVTAISKEFWKTIDTVVMASLCSLCLWGEDCRLANSPQTFDSLSSVSNPVRPP